MLGYHRKALNGLLGFCGIFILFSYLGLPLIGASISFGQTVSGSIAVGETDTYTFSAAAGNIVIISMSETSNIYFSPQIRLYSPGGTELDSTWHGWNAEMISAPLPSTGTYTILANDYYGTDAGDYNLTLECLNPGTGPSISFGQTVSGNLVVGDLNTHTFSATAGDIVIIRMNETSNIFLSPQIRLYSPDGTELNNTWHGWNAEMISASLPLTGTYTILASDSFGTDAGEYNLTLERLNPGTGPMISFGQTVSGNLVVGDLDTYTFFATAGNRVIISMSETSNIFLSPQIRLYSPDGTELNNTWHGWYAEIISASLPLTGTYTILASDIFGTDSGGYELTLERLGAAFELTQQVDKYFVWHGAELTYTTTYRNTGDADASNVVIEITLPSTLELVNGSISNGGTYNSANRRISWNVGSLQAGVEAQTVTFKAKVDPGIIDGTNIVLTAQISSAEKPEPVTASVTTTVALPKITSISPNKGGNAGTVRVTINGQYLDPHAGVKLSKTGQTDIIAADVTGTFQGTPLEATFNLKDKTPGTWDLVVTNPGGGSGSLADAFTIETGGETKLWVEIVGRDMIRVGREQTYGIICGNSGNVDTYDVLLNVKIPKSMEYKFSVNKPDLDGIEWSTIPDGIESNNEIVVPIWIYQIGANSTQSIKLNLKPSIEDWQVGNAFDIAVEVKNPKSRFTETGNFAYIEESPNFNNLKNTLKQSIFDQGGTIYSEEEFTKSLKNSVSKFLRGAIVCTIATVATVGLWEAAALGVISPWLAVAGTVAVVIYSVIDTFYGYSDIHQSVANIIFPGITVQPFDPNDKVGSIGCDPEGTAPDFRKHYISNDDTLSYMIQFENLETATAAVQDMKISDQLDANLNWSTFSFDIIQIGTHTITVPQGSQSFSTSVDFRPEITAIVEVECTFTSSTGQAQWIFRGTHPDTGELADFLPPNTGNVDPKGQGWGSYSIKPKANLSSGTVIKNKATIDFEIDIPPAPMDTPEWINTIDITKPESHVLALSPTQSSAVFTVQWQGTDQHSGIRSYSIYVSDSGGSYVEWISDTTGTSAAFTGSYGHSYAFYSIANDNVGNQEDAPAAPDTTTTVSGSSTVIINLNRTALNFGAVSGSVVTQPQNVLISSPGGGILNWTATSNQDWLHVSPTSETGDSMMTVSVDASGFSPGTYYGSITVTDPNASNSPQTIDITLNVYKSGAASEPFGEFATPLNGSTVSSSIPVTGWVLDDIGTESVKIYRKEGKSLVFIGDAVFVEGARPDVEQAYPDYPFNYRAGWGYMMLTNFLPNGGNGVFALHAIAVDTEGHQVTLGIKTITCDNANAVKPFGAIDTPAQGSTASGTSFVNWGWVLTPQPNSIPTNGSTIKVWINGINLGHPTYNKYREDIAALFPGYANSEGAAGYFYLDTTSYENGVHTIQWTAADDAGNTDGIGSRYFTIQNTGNRQQANCPGIRQQAIGNIVDSSKPLLVRKGYNQNIKPQKIYPDNNGIVMFNIKELERVEIHLNPSKEPSRYSGYQVVGDQLRPLPIGSNLETGSGTFSWQPGPGFIGEYMLVFLEKEKDERINKKYIIVKIVPRFK